LAAEELAAEEWAAEELMAEELMADELVAGLAVEVTALAAVRSRVLVGVDGPDAAGKTTLADRLAAALGTRNVGSVKDATGAPAVIRASVDRFHRPRAERYRRGEASPEGYYRDSFDLPALLDRCLRPFRAGAARIRAACFDHRDDEEVSASTVDVPVRAVLVVDGVFLLRPELRDQWDLSVYLTVPEHAILRRAVARDSALFGSVAETERRYRERYLPGQALYRAEADPEAAAHLVVDNTDPAAPVVLRRRIR